MIEKKTPLDQQACIDCGKFMSFEVFRRDNPTLTFRRAQELWRFPFIEKYCPDCYFKRPEKPYKKKRIRRWKSYDTIHQ